MRIDSQPTLQNSGGRDGLEKANLDTVCRDLGALPKRLTSTRPESGSRSTGRNELYLHIDALKLRGRRVAATSTLMHIKADPIVTTGNRRGHPAQRSAG